MTVEKAKRMANASRALLLAFRLLRIAFDAHVDSATKEAEAKGVIDELVDLLAEM